MSIEQLVSPQPQRTQIGGLVLDCLIRENHAMRNRVTAFPIEGGAQASDHIANEPREIQVEGKVSNTPLLFIADRIRQLARGEGSANYAQLAFEELERIHKARELVDVKGKLRTYKAMALVSLDVPRTQQTRGQIRFVAQFREVTRVEVRRAEFRIPPTKKENAQPMRNEGKKVPTETKPEVKKLVSTAKKGAQALGLAP